jgi:hypothetical protein
MTMQVKERVIYNGEEYGIREEPLRSYIEKYKIKKPRPYECNSGCWRAYVGKWEIKNNMLFLIDMKWENLNAIYNEIIGVKNKDNKIIGMEYVFPGKTEVFAEWFSGDIKIPQGNLLKSVHIATIYEKDLVLEFKNGYLLGSKIVENKEWDGKINPLFESLIKARDKKTFWKR